MQRKRFTLARLGFILPMLMAVLLSAVSFHTARPVAKAEDNTSSVFIVSKQAVFDTNPDSSLLSYPDGCSTKCPNFMRVSLSPVDGSGVTPYYTAIRFYLADKTSYYLVNFYQQTQWGIPANSITISLWNGSSFTTISNPNTGNPFWLAGQSWLDAAANLIQIDSIDTTNSVAHLTLGNTAGVGGGGDSGGGSGSGGGGGGKHPGCCHEQ